MHKLEKKSPKTSLLASHMGQIIWAPSWVIFHVSWHAWLHMAEAMERICHALAIKLPSQLGEVLDDPGPSFGGEMNTSCIIQYYHTNDDMSVMTRVLT